MKRWEVKERVKFLRRRGLSYNEIRKQVPIAKSTVSKWCKNITLTPEQLSALDAKSRLAKYTAGLKGAKSNQIKRAKEIQEIKTIAKSEISLLSKKEFKIAGLMLYWAEGHKSTFVGISNSDPFLIRFMMKWFRQICKIPNSKFRAQLHLHSGQDERQMKKYWSKITNIPLAQFIKSYIKKEGTGHRKNILYNGTIRINICNMNLLHKIQGWLEATVSNVPA